VANEKDPTYKGWSWVDYVFRPCGKSGKLLKAVIEPFSTAAYHDKRSNGSLDVFFTEDEANEAYVELAEIVRDGIIQAQQDWTDRFTVMLSEVNGRISNTKL